MTDDEEKSITHQICVAYSTLVRRPASEAKVMRRMNEDGGNTFHLQVVTHGTASAWVKGKDRGEALTNLLQEVMSQIYRQIIDLKNLGQSGHSSPKLVVELYGGTDLPDDYKVRVTASGPFTVVASELLFVATEGSQLFRAIREETGQPPRWVPVSDIDHRERAVSVDVILGAFRKTLENAVDPGTVYITIYDEAGYWMAEAWRSERTFYMHRDTSYQGALDGLYGKIKVALKEEVNKLKAKIDSIQGVIGE